MTGKTVLYVDDDLSRVERFGNLVKPDFDVETAFNGWDGVGASIMYHPDIVVFNLGVSVMTGLEAIRLIRSEDDMKNLPFLGFTIPRDPTLEQTCMDSGCTGILEELTEEVSNQLQKYL